MCRRDIASCRRALVFLLATMLLVIAPAGRAQQDTPEDSPQDTPEDTATREAVTDEVVAPDGGAAEPQQPGNTFIPFPFYFYTPETKSGGGVAASYITRPAGAAAEDRPSQYGLIGLITQRSQHSAAFATEHYLHGDRIHVAGTIGFSEFPTTFYGVGNATDREASEDYTPRTFFCEAAYERQVHQGVRTGPQLSFVDERIVAKETGGRLDGTPLTGAGGGRLITLGWSVIRDSRDNVFFPAAGRFDELSLTLSDGLFGSEFGYCITALDLRRYRALSETQVFATRLLARHGEGAPPFQVLPMLGGQNLLRGYYEGRFRDRNSYAVQAEYRHETWWRTGFVLFAAAGDVAHRPGELRLDELKAAYGFGLRILLSKTEKIYLRADFGRTDEGHGNMYLGMGEAF